MKISQHAKERFAQRIMNKNNKTEEATYIAAHEDRIRTDIMKMIQYGKLLYSGKPVTDIFNRQPVDIYLSGTYVIIVDSNKATVVTLYSIDLGVGAEMNEMYTGQLLQKLNDAKEHLQEVQQRIEEQNAIYRKLIEDNGAIMVEYRKIIKSLEEQNAAYKEIIQESEAQKFIAEQKVRNIVAVMIGKKVF